MSLQTQLKELVVLAVKWAHTRRRYRQILDSKSAEKDKVEKLKKQLLELTDKLEIHTLRFSLAYNRYVAEMSAPKSKFPWQEFLGAVSAGTGVLSKVMKEPDDVIEAKAEVIK